MLIAKAESILGRWDRGLGAITDFNDSARTLGPALAMIRDYPVAGVGLNNISLMLTTRHYGDQLASDERQVTHNLYLVTASETGLVGVGLFVSLGLLFLGRGVRIAWRARHWPIVLALAAGATAAILSVAVHSSTEWVARMVIITETVAIAAAVLTALESESRPSALRAQAQRW